MSRFLAKARKARQLAIKIIGTTDDFVWQCTETGNDFWYRIIYHRE